MTAAAEEASATARRLLQELADAPREPHGFVIRPGDRLVIGVHREITVETAANIRRQILERLPDLADVIVIAGDVSVYREDGDR